jgi:hypothetical protein
MKKVTELLLKHGIKGLLSKNEDSFKQNISQALAMKLNETIEETKTLISKDLLYKSENTKISDDLLEFVNFVKNFTPGNYTFKNGSSINITDYEMNLLKELFESLNSDNRNKMVLEILTDGSAFKQHITFSQKVQNLI